MQLFLRAGYMGPSARHSPSRQSLDRTASRKARGRSTASARDSCRTRRHRQPNDGRVLGKLVVHEAPQTGIETKRRRRRHTGLPG